MTDEQFRLEVKRLIRRGIENRSERMAAVSALLDEYEDRPDEYEVERLADYILHEELSDADPYKLRRYEYPIMSEAQLTRRVKGRTGRKRSNVLRALPISVLENESDSATSRPIYETEEEKIAQEVKSEVEYYKKINKNQPVVTCLMTAEDYEKYRDIRPIDYGPRGLEQVKWSRSVRRRDGFTCQKCGKKDRPKYMHAHHIEAYDTALEIRYDVNNGITLCRRCHNEFHGIYGYSGTTGEQLREWMEGDYVHI